MTRPIAPQVLLHLPAVTGRAALRAGLMAMQCVPENLPLDQPGRLARLQKSLPQGRVFCVIDISNDPANGPDQLTLLVSGLSRELRARTLLTRLATGHVSAADRAWVKALGFADLLPEFDARDPEGSLRVALDAIALGLGLPALAPVDLARYVRAAATSAEPNAPRTLIRARTGLSAELLADLLAGQLAIADRTYHLKKYAQCFIAQEAVATLARRFKLSPAQAVALGQALGALGLLYHVENQHSLADENLFFRLALGAAADAIDPGQAITLLQEKVAIADRSYLGTVYGNCWVGSEAVNVLCARYALARHEAHLLLHRLMQFGLFEHVVREQPFIDGNFFYRFGAQAMV